MTTIVKDMFSKWDLMDKRWTELMQIDHWGSVTQDEMRILLGLYQAIQEQLDFVRSVGWAVLTPEQATYLEELERRMR